MRLLIRIMHCLNPHHAWSASETDHFFFESSGQRRCRRSRRRSFEENGPAKTTARISLEAGCHPVVVVTGAHADASRRVLGELDVIEAKNEQWKLGISSSVRVGVEAVIAAAPGVDGIVLMLCDQP